MRVGDLRAGLTSALGDDTAKINLLLEAEDSLDVLNLSFNRRVERKRELVSHASRKYSKYVKTYERA